MILLKMDSFLLYDKILEKLTLDIGVTRILNKLIIQNDPVAHLLKNLSKYDLKDHENKDITYRQDNLSLSKEPGMIMFGKNEARLGRLVTQLIAKIKRDLSIKYGGLDNVPIIIRINGKMTPITEKDIEIFVKRFQTAIMSQNSTSSSRVHIVKGDSLVEVYDYEGIGYSLGKSCMVTMEKNTFQLYGLNDKIVSMATIWEGKPFFSILEARALIWKTSDGLVMDRIYANDFDLESEMKMYAASNNISYRTTNSFRESFVVDGITTLKKIDIELDHWDFNGYPYVDTFTFLDVDTGVISNYEKYNTVAYLDSTDGFYYFTMKSNYIIEWAKQFKDVRSLNGETYLVVDNLYDLIITNNKHCDMIARTYLLEDGLIEEKDKKFIPSSINYISKKSFEKIREWIIKKGIVEEDDAMVIRYNEPWKFKELDRIERSFRINYDSYDILLFDKKLEKVQSLSTILYWLLDGDKEGVSNFLSSATSEIKELYDILTDITTLACAKDYKRGNIKKIKTAIDHFYGTPHLIDNSYHFNLKEITKRISKYLDDQNPTNGLKFKNTSEENLIDALRTLGRNGSNFIIMLPNNYKNVHPGDNIFEGINDDIMVKL